MSIVAIAALERSRGGKLEVRATDFEGVTWLPVYPLLCLLTRVSDFCSGLELKAELLGKLSSLQIHRNFPKTLLREHYDHGRSTRGRTSAS